MYKYKVWKCTLRSPVFWTNGELRRMRYEVSVLLHGCIFVGSNSGDASRELIEQLSEEDIALNIS